MDDTAELEALEHKISNECAEPIKLSYGLMRSITDNFSNEIGRGGFGVVYKGVLRNGDVAVKKLSNPHALSDKQLLDEITCLKKAKHANIVRFLGYCSETQGEVLEFNGAIVMAEVLNKLLCFEYVPNGNIQHYLQQEKPHGDSWHVRYKMIRGICQGLQYLHDQNINHLDLKPENVMLDANMNPKITDFGLSRCLDQGQSKHITQHILGTPRYIAPEVIDKGEILLKTDIYALGIIIIELLTGINKIGLENWDESLEVDCPRVRRCSEMARKCIDPDKHNRPTIHKVVRDLDELESMIPWYSMNQATCTVFPVTELVDVHPLQLKFSFVPDKEMHCHLSLTNKTNGRIYCIIISEVPDRYKGLFKGFMSPMLTVAMTLHREAEKELPLDMDELEIHVFNMEHPARFGANVYRKLVKLSRENVKPSIDTSKKVHELLGGEEHRVMLKVAVVSKLDDGRVKLVKLSRENVKPSIDTSKKVHELLGGEEHRVMLKVAVVSKLDDGRVVTVDAPGRRNKLVVGTRPVKTKFSWDTRDPKYMSIASMDVHPTEPWVLIISDTDIVYIWNWQTDEKLGECLYPGGVRHDRPVAKFVALKQWVVVGDQEGSIIVHMCPSMDKVKEFEAHRYDVTSLDVHPTRPFLLSCSIPTFSLKLWDWDRNWCCTQIFEITGLVSQVMFHPKYTNSFAVLHDDGIVKMWRIDHPNPVATTQELICCRASNLFTYIGDRHFIATFKNNIACICNLQKEKHVHSIAIAQSNENIDVVVCHPTNPVLVTASDNGNINVWNSTTYRLMKTYLNLPKYPIHIGFSESRRLVIGYEKGIAVIDTDLE